MLWQNGKSLVEKMSTSVTCDCGMEEQSFSDREKMGSGGFHANFCVLWHNIGKFSKLLFRNSKS